MTLTQQGHPQQAVMIDVPLCLTHATVMRTAIATGLAPPSSELSGTANQWVGLSPLRLETAWGVCRVRNESRPLHPFVSRIIRSSA